MTGSQTLVGAGGVGLVVANFWFGSDRQGVSAGLFGSGDPGTAHTALVKLGGEMLLVVILTVLAGLSDQWGAAMAVVIVGLAILWAINHYSSSSSSSKTATPGGAV